MSAFEKLIGEWREHQRTEFNLHISALYRDCANALEAAYQADVVPLVEALRERVRTAESMTSVDGETLRCLQKARAALAKFQEG